MGNLKRFGEFGLINRFRTSLTARSSQVKVGIGDDCAVYRPRPGYLEIASSDALIEKVHFDLQTTTPEQLGRKAIAVNASDIAAMGGVPRLALISIAIPKTLPVKFLDRFYKGINQSCLNYQMELAGGDTVASPRHLCINITIIGEVSQKRCFLRTGARPGDRIFVTGTLGDSALGLRLLQSPRKKWLGSRKVRKLLEETHQDPTARVIESGLLAKSKARVTSMIDVSDGLIQDLRHLLKTDNLGADLERNLLPESQALSQVCSLNQLNPLDYILSGGEDYELLFTLHADDVRKLKRQFSHAHAQVSCIGEVTATPGSIRLIGTDGRHKTLSKIRGFEHF
jgi:thiamine-monophosphate kinase